MIFKRRETAKFRKYIRRKIKEVECVEEEQPQALDIMNNSRLFLLEQYEHTGRLSTGWFLKPLVKLLIILSACSEKILCSTRSHNLGLKVIAGHLYSTQEKLKELIQV